MSTLCASTVSGWLQPAAPGAAPALQPAAETKSDAVAVNEVEVREFIQMMSDQAARAIEGAGGTDRSGYMQLYRVHPDNKGAPARQFRIGDIDNIVKEAISHVAGGHNSYAEGRTVQHVGKRGRGKKGETVWVFDIFVDSDEDKGLAARSIPLTPSLVVESSQHTGNRHLHYFLDKAMTAEQADEIGKAIKGFFKAVGCKVDADSGVVTQGFRTAGTPNFPNATKRASGRVASNTRILECSGKVYTREQLLEAFKSPPSAGRRKQRSHNDNRTGAQQTEDDLPDRLLDLIRNGIAKGDRSDQFWHVVNELYERGWPPDEIVTLLERYPSGIMSKYEGRLREQVEHILEKISNEIDDGEDEAPISLEKLKELRRKAKVEREEVLNELNSRYAVANDAGQAWVLNDTVDHAFERQVYQYMKPHDLFILYANRKVTTRINSDGTATQKPVIKWWMEHKDRRDYINGIIFDPSTTQSPPGYLNLWRGFHFEAKQGSWSKLREHISLIVCGGNREYFAYLMGWLANLIQRPDKMAETAIVLRGVQGCGKGTLGHALRYILGQHAMHISNSKHLIGAFNAHLRDCVFLFADEAFFAGDKAGLGTLKALITESVLTIEAKFKNAIQCKNRLHVLMASNNEWVVPAAIGERRFFVLDVKPDRAQDTEYFGAIHDELENGGYAAMLYDLQHYDISKFNIRRVPETAALQDQKKHSFLTEDAWWFDVLTRGYVYRSKFGQEDHFGRWHEWVSTSVLYDSYSEFAKSKGERHPMSREALGKYLPTMGAIPSRKSGKGVVGEHVVATTFGDRYELVYEDRPRGYRIGSLDDARATFEARTGVTSDWDGEAVE
jgi:hypothetical protein